MWAAFFVCAHDLLAALSLPLRARESLPDQVDAGNLNAAEMLTRYHVQVSLHHPSPRRQVVFRSQPRKALRPCDRCRLPRQSQW
ncbi:hypothetical protein NOVOSPHI9U_40626 [Novosphingobium sp. 9U]|nr:hypothetical protein NOVOSPHI9U_40626 [Novosphingobium sp. 9U]